jgi:hypothetical protein
MKYTGLPFSFDAPPEDLEMRFVPLRSSDGVDSIAVLYVKKNHQPSIGVVIVHPRGDYSRFYAAPGMARQGIGVLCMNTRYLNNDIDAQQERMLLDVAGGMRYLRDNGMTTRIIFGNSGGGSLTTFYQWQAQSDPSDRLSATAGGDRLALDREDMPLAQGQIHVAVHVGEGHFMAKAIDPAVVDETDPVPTDLELDMYNPANGRRPFPEPSTYDRDWLARYRTAQNERCDRIDAVAKEIIARRKGESSKTDSTDPEVVFTAERVRRASPYLVIYRTLADPAYLDPSIDPSDRNLGTSFAEGIDPLIGNYGMNGLGRCMTPRGWLSTWSPRSTQADMRKSLSHIQIPSLFVSASGDSEILPGEFKEIVDSSPATDKTVTQVEASHYLRPLHEDDADPRVALDGILDEWISSRF